MSERLRITRRALLLGTSRLALILAAGRLLAGDARGHAPARGGVWSDGTWFDDDSGWTD